MMTTAVLMCLLMLVTLIKRICYLYPEAETDDDKLI